MNSNVLPMVFCLNLNSSTSCWMRDPSSSRRCSCCRSAARTALHIIKKTNVHLEARGKEARTVVGVACLLVQPRLQRVNCRLTIVRKIRVSDWHVKKNLQLQQFLLLCVLLLLLPLQF